MKKQILLLLFLFVGSTMFSQTLNQPANWPNTNWTVSGTFEATSLLNDPTTSANFSYDDDAAGSGSTDILSAESPVIDLTPASSAGETFIFLDYNYDYNLGDIFDLQYYDADTSAWVTWEALPDNSGTESNWCAAISAPSITSVELDISGFTANQLSNFQYRFFYDASSAWGWGFCVSSPTITSATPPSCIEPSGLTASNVTATSVQLDWTATTSTETGGYEYVLITDGSTPDATTTPTGSVGTGVTTANPTGLTAVTDYEAYVRAVCSVGDESAWSLSTSFTTPCDVFTPDYLEDFTNFVPDCWDEATDGDPTTGPTGLGSGDWTSDGFLNDGSSGSARINLYSTFKSDWLLSPSFDLSAGGFEVAFNIGITAYSGTSNSPMGSDDEVQLLYSDDNGATWNNLQTWAAGSEPSNAGELVTVDLSSITGTSVQFAFWGTEGTVDDAEDYNIYIDNFEVRTPPSCNAPTGLTASSVTANSVQLDWTATTSTETGGYEYVLITDGSTPDATTTPTGSVGTGVTTANPTGLTAVTDYEAYVRAVCSVGDESAWSLSTSFTTPCDVFTPDYLEDFTNFVPDCWDEATDGDPTTGPTGLGSGDWTSDGFLNDGSSGSARVELWNLGTSDWLLSPSFDLSAGGFEVAFNIGITAYSGTSNSPMGSDDEVQLLYSDDNGATWNNLQTWAAGSEPSNAGELVTVDLSSITGTSVQFAFWGTEGTVDDAEDYNIYIDNFEVRTPPSCNAPTGLTASSVTANSVQLDWTATTSTETGGYEYVLITDGSTPDATTTPTGSVGTGVTTANPTGLTPVTDYEAYVRAVCSVGDESAWSLSTSFTTPCDVFTPDYLEDFTNFVPDCWDEATDGDPTTGPTGLGSGSWTSDGFLNDGSSGSARINLYSTFKSDWLLSPSFDLSAGGFEVAFTIGITVWNNTDDSPMGSDDEVQLLYSDDNGATWNNLQTWAAGSEPSNAGELVTVDLSSITGTSVQFAFWGTEGTVDDAEDYNIYIDNFEVRTPPSCAAPTGLTASNVTATSVQLDWTATTSTETGGYEYVLITDGSTPDATTTPTGSVGTGVTTANPTGLTPVTDYEAYVRAVCSVGDVSAWSAVESFSTTPDFCGGDNFVDNGGLSGDYLSNSNETIVISPNNPGDVVSVTFLSFDTEANWDGLMIYDGPDTTEPIFDSGYVNTFGPLPDGAWNGTGDFSANGVTFTSTHPSGALTFVFTSDGFTQNSGWEADVICGLPPSCASPTDLTASNITTTSVQLDWTATTSTETGGYEYVLITDGSTPDATTTPTGSVGTGVTTANPTGLTSGTDYDAYVRAVCSVGDESAWSAVESFSTLPVPPANDNLCDAIALTIGTPSTGDAYTNVGATAQTDEPVGSCFVGGVDRSVWFTFIAPASGSVEVSTDIAGGTFVDTEIAVYEAPTDCADLTTLGAELGCDQDAGTTVNYNSILDLTGLTPGNTYYIQVDRWNTATPGTFGIEVNETLSTKTFDSQNFSFYPNPTQNTLNFQTTRQVESVVVYNMLGQQVMTETPNTVSPSLNVEALQAGTYIMNVTIDGSSENFRFIKK